AIAPRIVIGAVIIKHLKSLSDEETIEEIRENAYLQYFLGLPEYTYDQVFTPSLFVTIRRRLGEREFN
ncbi:MAG TPA: transposase, partial [Caldithrix sp.]|nr:transposase [Caldithrix sp.]